MGDYTQSQNEYTMSSKQQSEYIQQSNYASPYTSTNSVATTVCADSSPDCSPLYQCTINTQLHTTSPQSSTSSFHTTKSHCSSNASPSPIIDCEYNEKIQQHSQILLQAANKNIEHTQTNHTTQHTYKDDIHSPKQATQQPQQHTKQQHNTNTKSTPPQPIFITDSHGQQHDLAALVASNDTATFPGLHRTNRYKIIDNLQLSLFGSVKLAYDYHTNEEVAIKISARNLASDGRARSGVKVLENVKREANVMRYLANYRILHSIGDDGLLHCSCTVGCVCTQQAKLQQWQSNNPLDQSTDFICGIVDEIEDDLFHYLITEYVSGGDMHSLLLSMPNHRLNENQAKYLFRQLCLGIQFLHEHSIVHLDLSLENVCLSAAGRIKVIDFGVAVIHPLAPKPPKRAVTQALINRQTLMSHELQIAQPSVYNADSPTYSPSSTPIAARTRTLSSRARVAHGVVADSGKNSPINELCSIHGNGQSILNTFVCSNISDPRMQPGKVGYMSNELFGGVDLWDAYSNDTFSLGVILYCMLNGRPPFLHPHVHDPWYKAIASGQWLHMLAQSRSQHTIQQPQSQNDSQSFVQVFAHLSPDALDLLDKILKPQKYRITLRQVLAHPWLSDSNKRQRTHTMVAQVDYDTVMNNASPTDSPHVTPQTAMVQ